jgi:hypothetical protein
MLTDTAAASTIFQKVSLFLGRVYEGILFGFTRCQFRIQRALVPVATPSHFHDLSLMPLIEGL